MNTTNPTKGAIRPEFDCNTLLPLSPDDRGRALEMIQEIRDAAERHYCLASQINLILQPPEPGADSPNCIAWRLAQILDDLLADHAQMYRLISLLEGRAS